MRQTDVDAIIKHQLNGLHRLVECAAEEHGKYSSSAKAYYGNLAEAIAAVIALTYAGEQR